MASVTWAVDGHGQQWPWCEDCGKVFGPVAPFEVDHGCPPRSSGKGKMVPRRMYQDESGEWQGEIEQDGKLIK